MLVHQFRLEALAALDRLESEKSADGVVSAMAASLAHFGATFFCFNYLPRRHQQFEDVILTHRIPKEWLRLYLEKNFAAVDPSIRHCRRTVQPFDYTSSPYDPEREPKAAEVLRYAVEFRLSRGFLVPISSADGCVGDVWIGGYELNLSPSEKPIVHLLAVYAFDRVRRLSQSCPLKKCSFTAREREVLTWIAAGKTAWEIGDILGISQRTVEEHTQAATRKLGAANRTQAVALAIRDHFICP
jgi:LuxR family quorum sensing-dependent transcriptional regulator